MRAQTRLPASTGLHQRDGMLLTEVTTRDGHHRVYFTRVNSVIAYFEEDDDGHVCAHAEFAELACPYNRDPLKLKAVVDAMLEETGRRLHVRGDQVELMDFADIVHVCDPPLKERHNWTGRSLSPSRQAR